MLDSWDPIDCSPPGPFVHGISQARILEWVAIWERIGTRQKAYWKTSGELQRSTEENSLFLSTPIYNRVIDPFTDTSVQSANLTLKEEEIFCELQSGQTLKIRVINLSLDKFYRSVKEDPLCQKKALSIFMQFFLPVLLIYNWHSTLYTYKVYSIMILHIMEWWLQ